MASSQTERTLTVNLRSRLVRLVVAFAIGLVMVVVTQVLADYFGWHLAREAGGNTASSDVRVTRSI